MVTWFAESVTWTPDLWEAEKCHLGTLIFNHLTCFMITCFPGIMWWILSTRQFFSEQCSGSPLAMTLLNAQCSPNHHHPCLCLTFCMVASSQGNADILSKLWNLHDDQKLWFLRCISWNWYWMYMIYLNFRTILVSAVLLALLSSISPWLVFFFSICETKFICFLKYKESS